MQTNENIQAVKVRPIKDGEIRDRRGRWAGKVVTVRKPYYDLMDAWRKQTGLNRAEFWRQAAMRGAIEIAKSYGIDASFPALPDDKPAKTQDVKRKNRFPFWNRE